MRTPDAAELLALADAPRALPLERQRLLLEGAWPGDAVGADTPGERNERLLALRRALFGPHMECVADCAGCGTLLELALDTDELGCAGRGRRGRDPITLNSPSGPLRFRLPTMDDVASVACAGADAERSLALACCVEGERAELDNPELRSRLSQAFEAVDPLGHLVLELTCPECAAASHAVLDVGAALCAEIDALAERLLAEVHALASAYGWSEHDILALPVPRRRRYLALLAQ